MVLRIEKLCKTFGGVKALTNVSFLVKEGEIFGLIGPNGAGKTTLFNIITSMFSPTSGDILFLDEKITNCKPYKTTQKGICRTFQNIRLFSDLTVEENVKVGRHCRTSAGVWKSVFKSKSQRLEEESITENSDELLHLVDLSDYRYTIADNLSYGQQRRLEIARALASDPKLLLLDEPAAGMNETETKELYYLIKKIQARGITVLLIEHDMPLVMRVCDRIAVLNFGEKIAEGTPREIQNNPEVIEAYLGKEEDDMLA